MEEFGPPFVHTAQLKHFWSKTFVLRSKYSKYNGLSWSTWKKKNLLCLWDGWAGRLRWCEGCHVPHSQALWPPCHHLSPIWTSSLRHWRCLWCLCAGWYPLPNGSLSSCVEILPREQAFTFRSISTYALFITNLPRTGSSGHVIGIGDLVTACLDSSTHPSWKASTAASSGCVFVGQHSALPELADLPLARAGEAGTGVRKSNHGGCWHLESRREFSSALENTKYHRILLCTIKRRAGVLLCLCVWEHKELFSKHYPFSFLLLT